MTTPTNEYLAAASAHHAEAVTKAQELVADAQRQLAARLREQSIHMRLIARVEKQKAQQAIEKK